MHREGRLGVAHHRPSANQAGLSMLIDSPPIGRVIGRPRRIDGIRLWARGNCNAASLISMGRSG